MLNYQNPVWPGTFADPFVLRHDGHYYAYGTGGRSADGRVFPLLHSTDLVHWEALGGALTPLAGQEQGAYWAPEVAAREDRFYLYYSVADPSGDETHRLRVAVAETPAGPFTDAGAILPDEGFTIDAHPVQDPADGRWYLFFAKDFFDERAGTALAAAPLADDMISLAGPPVTILRASADWQIYERDRELYGRHFAAWHTLEGAFVRRGPDGRYYCLYSGGNWQTSDYGVGYAVADHILGPYTEPESGPVVLRGVPEHVLGPGHNSVVLGPDEQTEFIVYHAWDTARTARRLCIDPLAWTPSGPRCLGPTWTPQSIGRSLQT
jgi:beta-xylosidase